MKLLIVALLAAFVAHAVHAERNPCDVIAVVLGTEVTVADATEVPIDHLINGALLDRFARDNAIEVTEEDLDAYMAWWRRAREMMAEAEPGLEPEGADDPALARIMSLEWIWSLKVFKALFDKYGGRAHYQQVGVQPFDAVREFLEEQQAEGAFEILDEGYEAQFWAYWRRSGELLIPEEEAAELLAVPFWLQTEVFNEALEQE